ncbi:MAG TPA: metallophosphoesterase family protein [Candidatus Dormibacteraeota bacterium]|nr:metallophosphoesterase family protein [Candidatus Dormibacteraeota bacterium]
MRVALVADVHANPGALDVLGDTVREADAVVFLGDAVGYFCGADEAVTAVRALNPAVAVLGNHDDAALGGAPATANDAVRFGVDWAARTLTPANRGWLQGLPLVWSGRLGGRTWLVCHGSPWRPLEDYLYADSARLDDLAAFDVDIVAFAQTHRPLVRAGRPLLVNPGSVGQSRHRPGVACCALVDTASLAVEIVEREYDVRPVVTAARANGAGDWIERHMVPS